MNQNNVASNPVFHPEHGSMRDQCSLLRVLIVAGCFNIVLTLTALAQTAAPAPLPPAAQQALDKGIIAAKVPDYPLAIRFFEAARKLAPTAPVIFMNLGIAESKMPGRELRTMAWFGAYLAAYPDAPNAAAVKEQITVLDVRNQSNVSRLIKAVQDAASQVPGHMKDLNLVYVASLWAKAGDIAAATRVAALVQEGRKGQGEEGIVKIQAAAGDIAGAQKTADLISEPSFLNAAQIAIAEAQVKAADFVEAKRTSASALSTANRLAAYSKSSSQIDIAEIQVKAEDIAGARKTLAAALVNSKLIERSSLRPYFRIVKAQLKAGDIPGAQKTAELVLDGYERSDALRDVAKSQIDTGDIQGAKNTLASMPKFIVPLPDARVKNARLSILARTQLEIGDIVGAQKTADLIEYAQDKEFARNAIAKARAETRPAVPPDPTRQFSATSTAPVQQPAIPPAITVSDWLKPLDDNSGSGDCALNTAPFLDLAGHLKSLPPSDTSQGIFSSLHGIAEKMVAAGITVHRMLKQQALR